MKIEKNRKIEKKLLISFSIMSVMLLMFVFLASGVQASYLYQKDTIVCDKDETCEYNISYINNAAPEVVDVEDSVLESILLMNVPGRGGLDFGVYLDYLIGPNVKKEASWAGLGWQLNIPYIARGVKGNNVDDVDENYGWLHGGSVDEQDYYSSPWGRLVADDSEDFYTEDYKPILIKPENPAGGISNWEITDEDGTVYIFGKAVYTQIDYNYNISRKLQTYTEEDGWATSYSRDGQCNFTIPYAYVWYLTEIHSHDYIDDGDGKADHDDKGNWIRLEYKDPPELQGIAYRYPSHNYELYNISKDSEFDKILKYRAYDTIISFSYIENITTPLYNATFITADDREDAQSINRTEHPFPKQSPLRLDYIQLVHTDDTENILEVTDLNYFEESYRLAGNKLTLKNITFYGECEASFERGVDDYLPPIEFNYSYNPEYNPYAYDRWLFYNGETSNDNNEGKDPMPLDDHEVTSSTAAAWVLTNITWSSGAKTHYAYESNDYTYVQNDDVDTAYGGGIRVKSVTEDDGVGNIVTTTYTYGDGVATFVPTNDSMYLGFSSIGQHEKFRVDYEYVISSITGEGSVKTEFFTSKDYPDTTHSMDYRRGLIEKIQYRDTSTPTPNVVKQVDNTWSFGEISGFSDPYVSGYAKLDSVSTQLDSVTKTVDYTYNSKLLLTDIKEYGPTDNLLTVIDYVYDGSSSLEDDFENKNMLTSIESVKNYKNTEATLESRVDISYDDFIVVGQQLYPDKVTVWNDVSSDSFDIDFDDYDYYGNLEQMTDAEANIFYARYSDTYHYAYPTKGWSSELGSINDPVWERTYNDFGSVATSTDANDQVTTYSYDDFKRIKYIESPEDESASITYSYYEAENNGGLASNNLNYVSVLAEIDESTDIELTYYSDGQGKVLYTELEDTGDEIFTKSEYDSLGFKTKSYEPYSASSYTDSVPAGTDYVEYDYKDDILSRLDEIDYSGCVGGCPVDYTYSSSGSYYTVSVDDETGKDTTAYIDVLGNLMQLIDPDSNTIAYTHDILGNVLTGTNQENQVTTNTFDDIGRLLSTSHNDFGTIGFNWDDNSNIVGVDDAKNPEVVYEYDGLDRLTKIDYPTGTDTTFVYDSSPPSPPAGLDNPEGKLTSVTDVSGTTYFYYDIEGRLGRIDKLIDSAHYVTDYSYDSDDNLIKIVDMNDVKTEYNYNLLNQISSIKVDDTTIATYTYTAEGFIESIDYGADVDYVYNDRNWMQSMHVYDGEDDILERYYVYDDAGNIDEMHDALSATNKIAEFTYNNMYWLTDIKDYNYYGDDYGFTYDKIGNRMSKTVGETTDNYVYYSGTNLLQSDGIYNYTYDANGNRQNKTNALTGALIMNYTYNYDNQLIRFDDFLEGTTVLYIYDAFGQLIKKIDRYGFVINVYAGESINSGGGNDPYKFYLKDSSGNNVAWLGDYGNIVLKGTCSITPCSEPADGSFVIRDSSNEVVAYIDTNGNLCAESGSCSSSSTCSPSGDAFIIKDEYDSSVTYIEYDGELCFVGDIIENGNP